MKGSSTRALKDPSTDITSFFKVMIGDDFSEVLFLPPKFARTVYNLINQKFVLEDANGLRWTVTLSKNKGPLAFQKGWNAFSVEHGLKIGDFLVFKILKHDHFLVTIFGRSGCEKLLFPEHNGNTRKRKRSNDISNDKIKNFPETDSESEKLSFPEHNGNQRKIKRTNDIPNDKIKNFPETDSDNVNGQQSNSSAVSVPNIEVNEKMPIIMDNTLNSVDGNNLMVVSKSNLEEEPFYMINRDIGVKQGETRDSLYDLASIEMSPCDVSGSGKRVLVNEKSQQHNDTTPNFESEVSTVEEVLVAKEVQSCLSIPKVPKVEIMQKSRDVGQIDKGASSAKNDSKSKIAPNQCCNTGSGKEPLSVYRRQHTPAKMSGQNAGKKFVVGLDFSDLAASFKLGDCSSGKGLKQVKQEQVEMKEEACVREGIPAKGLKQVKQEKVEIAEEACVHGGIPGKSFHVVEQEQVQRKQEGFVHGGTPGYQWTMKLDESSYPSLEVNNHVPLNVKAEPVDTVDFITDVALKIKIPDSETPDKQPYLELPDRLVPISSRTKQRRLVKTLVIYLRGPSTGLSMWPVLYLEKSGRKILTSGWDAFRKANAISPGDKCVFNREDQYELIFRVTILHE